MRVPEVGREGGREGRRCEVCTKMNNEMMIEYDFDENEVASTFNL